MRNALFLDRDGVINVDRDYVYRIEDFAWQPGIFELARAARARALAIVVVTNQSGIGRGYYTSRDYENLTAFMRGRFAEEGAPLAAVYHAPYHPEATLPEYRAADHPWRKPRPGMFLAARDDLGIDLAGSFMVGDRYSDLLAATAAGIRHLAIVGTPAEPEPRGVAEFTRVAAVSNLVDWLAARRQPSIDHGR